MERQPNGSIDIEAKLKIPDAEIRVEHYRFTEPADGALRGDTRFHIDLCLNSRHRGARGCFPQHWKSHQYEKIGDIFLIPPYTEFAAKSDEADDSISVVCEFESAPVLDLIGSSAEPGDDLLRASLDIQSSRIQHLLLRLADEAKHPAFASHIMMEMVIGQLGVELARQYFFILDKQDRGGLAAWQLKAIDERLSEISCPPSLQELARLCRVSVRQLSRGFRVSRSVSLGAYVSQRQIEHAKGLLAADESIESITRRLGFSASSSFCHAFRRGTGMTPSQFRERLLKS